MTPPTPAPKRARTQVLIPKTEPPTRHPRRGGLGTLHAGERITVRFSAVDPDGAAVARLGVVHLSVPFGVPGEEAIVEVTKGGRRAQGRLVALVRKVPDIVRARCQHFGRCGGCQWQHLVLDAQRRIKTRLVKDYLKEHAGVWRDLVADVLGAAPWHYRSTLRAVFGERQGVAIIGYHVSGEPRVLDIAECPVQHPANEAMLRAARHMGRSLNLPVYDRETGRGLLRGIVGVASFASGEALLTLSTAAVVPDPSAVVRAMLDRVPGLVGILHTVQPHPTLELLGPRLRLLWGRDHVEDEIAGFRLRVRPTSELPPNPAAAGALVDAVRRAADLRREDIAFDWSATHPLFVLAMAQDTDSSTGVTPTRRGLGDARDAAAINGITNAIFYARDPLGVFNRYVARGRRPTVVVVTAEGQGLAPETIGAIAAARVPRVVYMARSLAVCARDLRRWEEAGYRLRGVYPIDLLPQTSHIFCVAALRHADA